jgi:hypothetical protein
MAQCDVLIYQGTNIIYAGLYTGCVNKVSAAQGAPFMHSSAWVIMDTARILTDLSTTVYVIVKGFRTRHL